MHIGVPRERFPGERRVAATPDSVKKLVKLGFGVRLERDAGLAAVFYYPSYYAAAATNDDSAAVWSSELIAHPCFVSNSRSRTPIAPILY